MPTDEAVVEAAAQAAEAEILSAFDRSAIADIDVRVQFMDGELIVDVYLDADVDTDRERAVAEDAVAAAEAAVDELFGAR